MGDAKQETHPYMWWASFYSGQSTALAYMIYMKMVVSRAKQSGKGAVKVWERLADGASILIWGRHALAYALLE